MSLLSIPEVLQKKRNGAVLSDNEINFFVQCVSKKQIDPSQIGAMLMAFCLSGLSTQETVALTRSMKDSGTAQKWEPSWNVVDKHSTGGVGDKVSIPLFAALATFGLKVPSVVGRGLGHTGGTADKLEAIPGFNLALQSNNERREALDRVGCYITTQSGDIAPVDKILYATRDITATVSYAPLICASIMSKKLSEGLQSLILDIKTGLAASTGTYDQAEWLAKTMVDIGNSMGVDTIAVMTEMDTPIGYTIGNSLETIESLECLKGRGPADLELLAAVQGGILLHRSGIAPSQAEAESMILQSFRDGSAFEKFVQMLGNQGVSTETIGKLRQGDYGEVFKSAKHVETVEAARGGYVEAVDAMTLGRISVIIGCGRQLPSDVIDMPVGIKLRKTKGDKVSSGEVLAEIHHNGRLTEKMKLQIKEAFKIGDQHYPIERIKGVVLVRQPTLSFAEYKNGAS